MAEETVKAKESKKKEEKSKKGLIIGCIVAAVVAIVAAIIVFAVVKPFGRANMVGKYELTSITANGEDQSAALALMKAFGVSAELEITDDKNGKMSLYGEDTNFTYDGKQFHFQVEENEDEETSDTKKDADYTFKDDTITMKSDNSEMVFTKKKE